MNGGGKEERGGPRRAGERKGEEGGREKEHISEAKLNLPRSVPRDSNQFEGSRISERGSSERRRVPRSDAIQRFLSFLVVR